MGPWSVGCDQGQGVTTTSRQQQQPCQPIFIRLHPTIAVSSCKTCSPQGMHACSTLALYPQEMLMVLATGLGRSRKTCGANAECMGG